MQRICLLLALIAVSSLNTVLGADMDEGVLVLTDDNFDEEIKKHENLLVEFYAPWCGHCKKLAPEYVEAAATLAKNDPPMYLAKVDATEQKKVAEEYGVSGFPTLKWFKNGIAQDYNGGRTADAIVSWILKKTGPPSLEVTCALLKEKTESAKFVLAFFGEDTNNSLFQEAHLKLSDTEEKIQFVHTTDAACATEFGASQPSIVFFRQFETKTNVWDGAADKEAILSWIKPLMVPTVFPFTEDEIDAVFGQQQDTVILFRDEADDEAAFMTIFKEAAVANKGKVLFSYAGSANQIQNKLSEFMGVEKDMLPTLRLIQPAGMKKFASETSPKDHTVESIGKFIDGVKDGSIGAHLKSATPPEDNTGPVTIVVGKEYEKIVMDKTKDVLMKFYAPWCGHCKKLAPVWEEIGEAFKDHPNVVIAKFDATANEADGVEIRGYPTLKWYPRDNKEGVSYDGERDLESFKKFINENSGVVKDAATAKQEEL